MLPRTARYLDLVRLGRNQWWRYALAVPLILFFWLVLGYLPYFALSGMERPDPMLVYVVVNCSIFMMLAGLAIAMHWLHRRPMSSLVTPEPAVDWKRVAQGAAVWGVLALAAAGVEHALHPDRYVFTFDPARFFMFAALVLLLTPIQTTAEELLFRGYILQALWLLVRRPVPIAVASALVFTVPHLMNPEAQRYGIALLAAGYFTIGLLLAAVTLRDGRLELAIGVHAANNLVLALIANYDGSVLATEAVFTARELDPAYSLVSLIVATVAFYWWFFGRGARAH